MAQSINQETAPQWGGSPPSQIPAVGPMPSAAVCLIGSLLYSESTEVVGILRLVLDDDIESPALATLLATIRWLVAADRPAGPTLVLAELRRLGELTQLVADGLRAAVTSGACAGAAGEYAGAVVGESLRRRMASAGHALTEAAGTAAELDLAPLVAQAAASVSFCAHRLAQLRGEQ